METASIWIIICAGLVLLMIFGLALFYGGMTNSKNVLSVVMYPLSSLGLVSLQWYIIGYSLAWGDDIFGIVGALNHVFLNNVGTELVSGVPHILFMLFQGMFAVITAALIGGAVIGRMKFSAWLFFILIWSVCVYNPLCHMVWHPEGFLLKRGGLDFAGGLVVHISSGISAVVLCVILGNRLNQDKNLFPHNIIITLTGAGLLWVGWFGFNGGSALASINLAVNAVITTHLAAIAGLSTWMALEYKLIGKVSVIGAISGALAGLVAITPGAGFVKPISALSIGAIGAITCYFGIKLKNIFNFDDSLDVFGIHGIGGIIGALLTGVFASKLINSGNAADGLIYNLKEGLELLFEQCFAIIVVCVYSIIATYLIAKILDKLTGLRIAFDIEKEGVDFVLHGENAYHN